MRSSAFALTRCGDGSCKHMMPELKDMNLSLPHPQEGMVPVKWAEASEELSPFAEEARAHSVKNSFRFYRLFYFKFFLFQTHIKPLATSCHTQGLMSSLVRLVNLSSHLSERRTLSQKALQSLLRIPSYPTQTRLFWLEHQTK